MLRLNGYKQEKVFFDGKSYYILVTEVLNAKVRYGVVFSQPENNLRVWQVSDTGKSMFKRLINQLVMDPRFDNVGCVTIKCFEGEIKHYPLERVRNGSI